MEILLLIELIRQSDVRRSIALGEELIKQVFPHWRLLTVGQALLPNGEIEIAVGRIWSKEIKAAVIGSMPSEHSY